jgi:transcriptional regulator with XRE-family HTH domain
MARRGLGLRELARRGGVDPSLLSKVLAGKRSPPSDEETLTRLAAALEIDAVELVVSAGRIPSAWSALWSDSALVRAVHRLASGRAEAAPVRPPSERPRPSRSTSRLPELPPSRGLSEELL